MLTDEEDKIKVKKESTENLVPSICFEFGDVKEILEKISRDKTFQTKFCEDATDGQETIKNSHQNQTTTKLKTKHQADINSTKLVPTLCVLTPDERSKFDETLSLSEKKPKITVNVAASLPEEPSCLLDKTETDLLNNHKNIRNAKYKECKSNAKNELKRSKSATENRSSHFKNRTADNVESFGVVKEEEGIPETWTKVQNTKKNKSKAIMTSSKKKPEKKKTVCSDKLPNNNLNNNVVRTCRFVR